MSFKSSSKKKRWEGYCSEHSDFIAGLNLNGWIFHTENNFREFATYGFTSDTKDIIFSFQMLNDEQYQRLFHFITSYFEMDMENFTNFNRIV